MKAQTTKMTVTLTEMHDLVTTCFTQVDELAGLPASFGVVLTRLQLLEAYIERMRELVSILEVTRHSILTDDVDPLVEEEDETEPEPELLEAPEPEPGSQP